MRVVLPGVESTHGTLYELVFLRVLSLVLFFLLLINGVVTDTGSNIRLFAADDTSLFIIKVKIQKPLLNFSIWNLKKL